MKDVIFTTQFESSEERFNRTVSILILITMTFLIFYFVSLSWFGESDFESGVVTVGEIAVSVTSDLNFDGVFLEPNKTYNKQTTVVGNESKNTNDAYIRVKLETSLTINDTNVIIPIYNTEKWEYDGNSWYYYKGFINNETSATFNTALKVHRDLTNEHQNTEIVITLTVDAIQRDFKAYEEDPNWATAPTSWKNYMSENYDTESTT